MKDVATILLVEDDVTLLEGIADLLEVSDTGYDIKVLKAVSGLSGLRQLTEQVPDLILSDIMMPGMDGFEFLDQLRREPAFVHIPVVFLTAKGTKQDILRGRLSGAELYITKPYESDELITLVKSQLDRTFQLKLSLNQMADLLRRNIVKILNHEFRTPLTYVTAYYELLESGLDSDSIDSLRQYLQGIQAGTIRLVRLVRDLVYVMELWTGEFTARWRDRAEQIADLGELIPKVVLEHSRNESGHEIAYSCDVPEKLPIVYGDRESIRTIINRLLDNAIKFSVVIDNDPVEVKVKAKTDNNEVLFSVEDHGVGFPESIREEIFDLFFQHDRDRMEQQGSGAGLTIVRGLVELHGGRIDVHSIEGEGSTFTVVLPVYQPDGHSPTDDSGGRLAKRKATILLVEDEKPLLVGLKDLLEVFDESYDFKVLTAENGSEGLEVLARHTPDLIISDIMMPQLDGYQFLDRVRQNPAWVRIPVIFLTAKGERQDILQGRSRGVEEYISKPYQTTELHALVVAQLDRYFQRKKVIHQEFEQVKRGVLELLEIDMGLPLVGLAESTRGLASRLEEVRSAADLKVYLRSLEISSRYVARLVKDFIFLVELRTGEAANRHRLKSRPEAIGLVLEGFSRSWEQSHGNTKIFLNVDPKYSQVLILCDLPILTWAMERLVEAVVDNFSQKPTVSLTVSESDPYIDIYLSLTAQDCSIEKSTVSRINDLMAQREPTVSELSDLNPGFFIAKSAIDMHNGAISLDQKEKNGCGVTIALPVYLPDEEVIRHV